MILKVNSNPNFKLSMILDNIKNNKRQMKTFKSNEFSDAINQYNQWEQFIF